MATDASTTPDHTAVRVALWRALHVELDDEPHVLEDSIGLALAAPEAGWRERGDMHPEGTSRYRASVVARTRFVEDLVVALGVDQYVLLGAGLDTFAQRRPDLGEGGLRVYEIDEPGTQAWKRERLAGIGYGIPGWHHLVPFDFEAGGSWWERLEAAGFDAGRPALVASTGVSMYLTEEANAATLRRLAALAPGSSVVMTFMPPMELVDEEDRPGRLVAERGARAAGTPFISFFSPAGILALARASGFAEARHVPAAELNERYFNGRKDGLRTSNGEELLVATT
jgi:methyltransferase (TIGR00027 family)